MFSQHWAMEALTSYFTDKKKEDEVQVKSQTVGLQDLLLFIVLVVFLHLSF